jgi:hypothetical protein
MFRHLFRQDNRGFFHFIPPFVCLVFVLPFARLVLISLAKSLRKFLFTKGRVFFADRG